MGFRYLINRKCANCSDFGSEKKMKHSPSNQYAMEQKRKENEQRMSANKTLWSVKREKLLQEYLLIAVLNANHYQHIRPANRFRCKCYYFSQRKCVCWCQQILFFSFDSFWFCFMRRMYCVFVVYSKHFFQIVLIPCFWLYINSSITINGWFGKRIDGTHE